MQIMLWFDWFSLLDLGSCLLVIPNSARPLWIHLLVVGIHLKYLF